MNKFLMPLLTVAAVLQSLPAAADVKIGFVNSQRVLNEAPQAAKAKKKLEKEFEKTDQELQKMAKQLQTLQESLEKSSVTLSESDRRNKEHEFAELNREFQRKQRSFREDLNLRQNDEMASIFERVNKVIKGIAEADKYDIIFQEAVWASPRIDLTDKVIKALGDSAAGAK